MDVHKESIEIALADEDLNTEVRRYGKIGGTQDALRKALRKLASSCKSLHSCYEAEPCGYEIYRYLVSRNFRVAHKPASVNSPNKCVVTRGDVL